MTVSETAAAVLQLGEKLAIATDTATHDLQLTQVRQRLQHHLVAIVLDTHKRAETPEVVTALASAAADITTPTTFWELVEHHDPDHQITSEETQFVTHLFAQPAFMQKIETGLHALARETRTPAADTAETMLHLHTMSAIAHNAITATPDRESQMIQRLRQFAETVDEAIAQQDQAAIDGYRARVEELARKMNRR